jgi:pimeloyl-ACP methyl ester carboxylesterase
MSERDVKAADGRILRIAEGGAPDGVPVIKLEGTPVSRLISAAESADAATRGVRLITYDRPGYGGSARLAGRNVADCAADVRAIAGALGITRLGVWGISGGGPHALACAGLLRGLVPAVGVIASPAPYGVPGGTWLDGRGEGNVAEFRAAVEGESALRPLLDQWRADLTPASSAEVAQSLASLLSPADLAAYDGAYGEHAAASLQAAIAPGVDGWLDDDLAFVGDWGFGLSQNQTPVLLLHGAEDWFVPIAHGRWLADNVPEVEGRFFDDEGHLSLEINRLGELYDWLLPQLAA